MDIINEDIYEAMEEMEDNRKDSQEDNDDEEILAPPEEAAVVWDLTVTEDLNTFLDYWRQKKVENGISLMVGSLNRKLQNMCLSLSKC